MDNTFNDNELLYRAVFPPEYNKMFWKDENHVSSAAFLDKKGLSVERGNFRSETEVVSDMKKIFIGSIISVTVKLCRDVGAFIIYKPTKRSLYHSEIHGSKKTIILSPSQRHYLSKNCKVI